MSAFAALLRRSLAAAGMSQMDLARAVGTSSSVVSQACTGRRPPPLGRVEAWAEALRLTPAERTAFLAAAQLAHAPEPVRRRIEHLEQHLPHEESGWNGRRPPVPRVAEGQLDLAALRDQLDACRQRAAATIGDDGLPDAAWEIQTTLAALLVRLADARLDAAEGVRTRLERAVAACGAARPTRLASLRAALRRVARELARASDLLAALAAPPHGRSRG
jgi:transcriptional regulator with XRE-family HTH domain